MYGTGLSTIHRGLTNVRVCTHQNQNYSNKGCCMCSILCRGNEMQLKFIPAQTHATGANNAWMQNVNFTFSLATIIPLGVWDSVQPSSFIQPLHSWTCFMILTAYRQIYSDSIPFLSSSHNYTVYEPPWLHTHRPLPQASILCSRHTGQGSSSWQRYLRIQH